VIDHTFFFSLLTIRPLLGYLLSRHVVLFLSIEPWPQSAESLTFNITLYVQTLTLEEMQYFSEAGGTMQV
jgi:hypothetical protein